jgi:hypothetical protein
MKRVIVAVSALLFIIYLFNLSNLSAQVKKSKNTFKAELASKMLESAGKTKARGHADFEFSKDGKELNYSLYVYGIDSVSMAHIHHGPFGKEGPIAVWLYKGKITGKFNGMLSKGTITDKDVNLDSLHTWMTTGNTFVLVHTQKYPNGEIGGKIQ